MPRFKVNFFMELGNQGWTETFFRTADSPIQASVVAPSTRNAWQQLHPPACEWIAVRAALVGSPFVSFLRGIELTGAVLGNGLADPVNEPDVSGTSALVRYQDTAGIQRNAFIRGLRDIWTLRQVTGAGSPMPDLDAAIGHYVRALKANGFGWQFRQRSSTIGFRPSPLVSARAVPATPQFTEFTVAAGNPVPAANTQVIISRVPRQQLPGANGVWPVQTVAGQTFTIPLIWRSVNASETFSRASWRNYGVVDTSIDAARFERLVQRRTGRPTDVPRGRSQALRRRV